MAFLDRKQSPNSILVTVLIMVLYSIILTQLHMASDHNREPI